MTLAAPVPSLLAETGPLSGLDLSILAGYLLVCVGIGFAFRRAAGRGSDDYFLGGRKLPWWALGASGMASNVDVAGTAIAVALVSTMGLRGFFVELRGGVVLIMAFLLAFMGRWNRRSGAMTRAEWMIFRFGDDFGGRFARIASAAAELLFTVSAVAFFAKGLEVFIEPFFPALEPNAISWMASGVVLLVTIYTSVGGLVGVVWTDVFQGFLILVAVLAVCFLAWGQPLPEAFLVSMPEVGGGFVEVLRERSDFEGVVPPRTQDLPGVYSKYNAFGLMVFVFLIRASIDGASGSGGYIVQRYLAAKTEREAGLVGLAWTTLLAFRWPLVVAFAMLGVHHGVENGAPIENPESVLPTVLAEVVPHGLRGLLLACFLAAFMSTFSSVVNSAAAYWTNDVYGAFIKPQAGERSLVLQGRVSSLILVVLGLSFAQRESSINDLWGWLTAALGGGLAVPLLLRWYWWRFNGQGFAIGTLFGMSSAALTMFSERLAAWTESQQFVFNALVSLAGCLIGSLAFASTQHAVLQNFFSVTRPFGAWRPCRDELSGEERAHLRKASWRELASALIAVPWQIVLFLLPMTVMVRSWPQALGLFGLLAVLSVLLYFVWYRSLSGEKRKS